MTKVNLKEKLKFKGSEDIEKNSKAEEKFQWSGPMACLKCINQRLII